MIGTATVRVNPFKFLHYFEEQDEHRFAGREQDIEAVTARIIQAHSFVLYGASGSGKTSLIRAAVMPELERRGYKSVYVRMLRSPSSDLLSAAAAVLDSCGESEAEVTDRIKAVGARTPVVIILDQFEEFFIRFRGSRLEREELIDLLGRLHRQRDLDLRLVFSLRHEYLGELDDFRRAIPELFDHEYRLRSLTGFGARQAIAKQLNTSGIPYEPRFLAATVERLEPLGFDPTLLQLLCSEAYRRAELRAGEGEVRLTAADIEEIKDIPTLFQSYLTQFRSGIDKEEYLSAQALLDALISSEDTKRAITVDWLAEAGFRAPPDRLQAVLEALVRAHLVREDSLGSETWYELTHERLVDVIRPWLASEQSFRDYELARDLVANAFRMHGTRTQASALLNPAQVTEVVTPQMERLALAANQEDFVFRSAVLAENREVLERWAERIGPVRSRDTLAELLDSEEADLASAAVLGAGWLRIEALREKCIQLAVSSLIPEIRIAATRGLAAQNTPGTASKLLQAARRQSSRSSAIETVGRFHAEGGSVRDLDLWRRATVRRAARKQQLAYHRPRIDKLRRETIRAGVAAAIGWTCSIGAVGSLVASNAIVGAQLSEEQLPSFFMLLGISFVVSLTLGYTVGHRGAKIAVVNELPISGPRGPLREWLQLGVGSWRDVLVAFLAGAFVGFGYANAGEGDVAPINAVLLGGSIAALLGAGLAAFAALQAAVAAPAVEAEGRERRWLWAVLAAVGLPLLVPELIEQVWNPDELRFDVGLILVMGPAALLSCYSTVLLMVGDASGAGRTGVARRPAPARFLLLTSAVLSMGYALWAYGLDSLRFPPAVRRLALADTVAGELGFGPADVDHFLISIDSMAQVVRVDIVSQANADVDVNFASHYVDKSGVLVVPPGTHWVSVYPFLVEGSRQAGYELQLSTFPSSEHPVLTDTTWHIARVRVPGRLAEPMAPVLHGTVASPAPGDMVEVIFPSDLPWSKGDTTDFRFVLKGGWSETLLANWSPESTSVVSFAPGTAEITQLPGESDNPTSLFLRVAGNGSWGSDIGQSVELQQADDVEVPADSGRLAPDGSQALARAALVTDTVELLIWVRRTNEAKVVEQNLDVPWLLQSEVEFNDEINLLRGDLPKLAGICRRLSSEGDGEHAFKACSMAADHPESRSSYQDVRALAGIAASLTGRADADKWLDQYLELGRASRPVEEYAYYAALRQDASLRPKTIRWSGTLVGERVDTVLQLPAADWMIVGLAGEFDTVLEVTSPSGFHDENDDFVGGGSRLTAHRTTAGQWQVRVRGYELSETGTYSVTIRYLPALPPAIAGARRPRGTEPSP